MIDHFNIPVSQLEVSKNFYLPLLQLFGLQLLHEEEDVVGFGVDTWVLGLERIDGPINPLHFALSAASPESVKALYSKGLALGASDNGSPGPRPEYGQHYYAAYLLDPDGHNFEVVCRKPQNQ